MGSELMELIIICKTAEKISKEREETKRIIEIEKTTRTAINAEKEIHIKAIEEKGETIRRGIKENTNYSINQIKEYSEITKEAIKYGDKEIAHKSLEKMSEESKNHYAAQRENIRALTTEDKIRIGRSDRDDYE